MDNRGHFDKVILVEIKVGIDLAATVWTLVATGTYRAYPLAGNIREIVDVEVDGVPLTEVYTGAACNAAAGSYFWENPTGRLKVHLSDDSDPATHTVVAKVWLCLSNRTGVEFAPAGCDYPVQYLAYLSADSIPNLTQSVADYYTGAVTMQFGSVSCVNDGWWYLVRKTYLWNNKEIYVRVGEVGDAYADFQLVFPGRIRGPRFADDRVVFEVKDMRIGSLRELPTDRFDTSTYTNLEDGAENREIPILFGEKIGITPVCIDTTTWTYKISQTTWDGVSYPLESIDAVYRDGTALTVTTDYTVDLTNGEFTLLADPGDRSVTCDAHGIQDKFDLTSGTPLFLFADTVAHHLMFVLLVLNRLPVTAINLTSFQELSVGRTQQIGWYLDTAQPTLEFVRLLQQSAIFHLVPLLDGTYSAIYYRRAVPATAPALDTLDLTHFQIWEEPESVYKAVVVKYGLNPTTREWIISAWTQDDAAWLHDEQRTLTIETALVSAAEADTIRDFFVELVRAPGDKVDAGCNLTGLDFYPTEKVILSRVVEGSGQETPINVLSAEIYRLLEVRKNLATGAVDFIAQVDSQASTYAIHADIEHVDQYGDHTDSDPHVDSEHTDDHTDHSDTTYSDVEHDDTYSDHDDNAGYLDTAYEDVAHVDSHTDTHSDTAHTDVHGDVAHADISHLDGYADTHLDVAHADIAHADVAHADVAHTDTPHSDTAHTDVHVDREIEPYMDSHSDIAHEDVAHGDSHADTAHADVAHTDSHSDSHTDSHSDRTHSDSHTDTHSDVTHVDAHADVYVDTHTDEAHEDHTDVLHIDAHTDVPAEDHTDAAHDDSYADLQHQDHTDSVPHGDTAHSDSHTDSHTDSAHADYAHADTPHADTPHADEYDDMEHADYSDGGHSDDPHADTHTDDAHADTAYVDGAHADSAHADTHGDVAYSDTPHLDHTDNNHLDYHGDVAHDDSSV